MALDLSKYGIDPLKSVSLGTTGFSPIGSQTSAPKATTAPITQSNPIIPKTPSTGSSTTMPNPLGSPSPIGSQPAMPNYLNPLLPKSMQSGTGAAGTLGPIKGLESVMPAPIAPAIKPPAPPMTAGGGLVGPGNTLQTGSQFTAISEADRNAAAAAASAGRSAAASSAAAGRVGQEAEKASAASVAAASDRAAVGASAPTPMTAGGRLVGPGNAPQAATETTPAPAQTGSSAIDATLAEFANIAKGWATGTDDSVFRITANRVIDSLALLNNAERDALQMRINQDPSLRGQGAGQALLSMMTRDQNFKVGDVFAQLSQDSRERIVDLQKYGLGKWMEIEALKRKRTDDGIQNLIKAGNFADAASAIEKQLERDGLSGITIDPKSLEGRDQFSASQFTSRMQSIKELATIDPNAAIAMLGIEMANPANKGWFPEGATPQQFIETLLSTGTIDSLQKSQQLNAEINRIAASQTSKFSEAEAFMKELFRSQRRDAIDEGRKLSVEDINKLRSAEGLPGQFSVDAAGNIVDETGLALTDEDYAEFAYMAEWADRKEQAQKKPWDTAYELILSNPEAAKFLDEENFPGGKDALKSFLFSYFMDTGAYSIDPSTGLPVPDPSSTKLPWDNPKYYPMFFTWPKAVFDEKGDVVGKYDMGGDIYGEAFADGSKVTSTPEDDAMDKEYAAYVRSGGTLTAPQWYFASAGGTRNPDLSKVPAAVSNPTGAESHTNVGGTGSTTPATPGTKAAVISGEDYIDSIYDTLPASVDSGQIKADLATIASGDLSLKDAFYTKEWWKAPGRAAEVDAPYQNPNTAKSISQAAWDYYAFLLLKDRGLTDQQAMEALVKTIGDERAKKGYEAMTLKKWSA